MKCLGCGSEKGRARPCCEDVPVFCDRCTAEHVDIAHKPEPAAPSTAMQDAS